ncbi:hypothetical protein DESC_870027 [Desulfosarcina cetonica]|nr:hypothetical protein DESC_870027 [Desulfosarcina cetonica]
MAKSKYQLFFKQKIHYYESFFLYVFNQRTDVPIRLPTDID